jgi:phage shock protein B
MQAIVYLSSVLGLIVIFVALLFGTLLTFIKILKGDVSRKRQRDDAEEAGMIQEIFQGMGRMEGRVEALETLLLDRERKEKRQ